MSKQEQINYTRIAKAIDYIRKNFKEQPSLDDIASSVHLSPSHFQRLFSDWAGVSPKKFIKYLSVEYAKKLLRDEQTTLLDASHGTGLSGTGRLHDLFVNIEGMTPGDYKNGGENLTIYYSFAVSRFGKLLIASTPKGVCNMTFVENEDSGLKDLKERFPQAKYEQNFGKEQDKEKYKIQQDALYIFQNDWSKLNEIKLHLKASDFQLKVWEALLKIPMGDLVTYGSIAQDIDSPNASRAVGTAIGKNPIAFLIPCHRVIQSSGNVGGYRWGSTRKSAMIGWEASQVNT